MGAVKIGVKKYGQTTRVTVDGKHAYDTAVVVPREIEKLKKLIDLLDIENTEVVEAEK